MKQASLTRERRDRPPSSAQGISRSASKALYPELMKLADEPVGALVLRALI